MGVDFDDVCRGSLQDLLDAQIDVRNLLRTQHDAERTMISTGRFTNWSDKANDMFLF